VGKADLSQAFSRPEAKVNVKGSVSEGTYVQDVSNKQVGKVQRSQACSRPERKDGGDMFSETSVHIRTTQLYIP
jgi:hypothetical protein